MSIYVWWHVRDWGFVPKGSWHRINVQTTVQKKTIERCKKKACKWDRVSFSVVRILRVWESERRTRGKEERLSRPAHREARKDRLLRHSCNFPVVSRLVNSRWNMRRGAWCGQHAAAPALHYALALFHPSLFLSHLPLVAGGGRGEQPPLFLGARIQAPERTNPLIGAWLYTKGAVSNRWILQANGISFSRGVKQ